MTAQRFFGAPFARIGRSTLISSLVGLALLGFAATRSHGQLQTLSLVWSDEFNSVTSSNLDTTKWTYDTGNNNGWGNNELEYYTKRTNNAYVAGGLLHIHAQIEHTNGFNYTSARIKTQGLFNTLYGRIEWRAQLPPGTGMWPALWMMGSNSVSVPWPGCGEIDVVENNGANITFVQGSIHSGTDATQIYNFTGGNTITNFHVYDLDWISNSITWSVDGTAYETQTSWGSSTTNAYPYPFNKPFYLLMNLAVGGDYVNDPSTNSINPSLPAEMLVDYVRVYQFVPVISPVITSILPSNGCASGGTTITLSGANFQSGSTITIFGAIASNVTFVNSNTLTAVTTANAPGTYNVVLKTPGKSPTIFTNGFTYASPPLFGGIASITPAIEGATLSWSSASGGMPPLTYNVYQGTNSGGESGPILTTNALSALVPLFPGSNSPITYFFTANAVDSCSTSDTNQVELSVQPLLDPNASQVGDGIPNSWKEQYNLNPFDPSLATEDADGDGMNNLQEYLAGTDPTNSASLLQIISVQPSGSDLLVTWMTGLGRTNALQWTAGEPDGSYATDNFTDIFTVTNTASSLTNYLDTGAATNAPARYYRVRLVP